MQMKNFENFQNNTPTKNLEETNFEVIPGAIESLLNPDETNSLWPKEIIENRVVRYQAEQRTELSKNLDVLFSKIPDATTEISQAVALNNVEDREVVDVYNNLSDFFLSDPANSRMALYLPFEILPNKNWKPESTDLERASKNFADVYMTEWHKLLSEHDTRANFSDGDILEEELINGRVPVVSKACHLSPQLVEKNLLSIEDVLKLTEKSTDNVMRNSIADTIPVLADMGLLSEISLKKLQQSHDQLLYNMSIIVKDNIKNKTESTKNPQVFDETWKANLQSKIDEEFKSIQNKKYDRTIPARAEWQRVADEQHIVKKYAEQILLALKQKSMTENEIEELEAKVASTEFARVVHQVKTWSVTQPNKFHMPFSEKEKHIQNEIAELRELVKKINTNPELSKFVYPAAVMYGSKIKDYSNQSSDTDIAIFIKPDTAIENRKKIQELLKENNTGKLTEFWLTKNENDLEVQDFERLDGSLADVTFAPVLLQGILCGDDETIKELYKKLLPGYLYSKNKKIDGIDARKIWLKETERASLQYRLMHKGYANHLPKQGGIETENSSDIDSESMFWDSGYRRVATQLFLKKVFLPQLEK